MVEKKEAWDHLVQVLAKLNAFDPPMEEAGVFLCREIGGPQGSLPFNAASFAIKPSAASLLDELAGALKTVGTQFHITIHPDTLEMFFDVGDAPEDTDSSLRWAEPGDSRKVAALEEAQSRDVSAYEVHVTRHGEVWFHVDLDGPSTADVLIPRAILREIAEGPSSGPAPGA